MSGLESTKLLRNLDHGLSLPAAWYTEPGIAELERERIFHRTWQYAGRTEQVNQIGDYLTSSVGEVPVVIVCNDQGLQGFVNVCRHRRHEVVSGCGAAKLLQCPYHAWTYDLHGRLKAAPRSDREPDFDKESLSLLPVRVESWGPWLFVNLDPGAQPLANELGELPQLIISGGLDLNHLHFRRRYSWRRNANWKVMLENYLECYHCPVQHPGFSAVIDVDQDAYLLKAYRRHLSQSAPVRAAAIEGTGKPTAYDARGAVTQAQYHLLWPNFTININPGQPNLSLDVWLPDGPGWTHGFSEYYFGPEVTDAYARELMAFSEQVGNEDDALTSSVQRGVRAGVPVQGRFLVSSEHLVVQFQRWVVEALG